MTVLIDPSLRQDFEAVNSFFGYDCSNIGDLDEVARLIAYKAKPDPNYIKDNIPPWVDIYDTYLIALEIEGDHDMAWLETVKAYPDAIRMAIRNICQFLINQHTNQNLQNRKKRKTKTKELSAWFKRFGFRFALNTADDTIYVTEGNNPPEIMGDIMFSFVYRALIDAGVDTSENNVLHAINIEAKRNKFHPVRDYLDSLAWDGQPHIARLAEHFVDKHGMFSIYLRRWLIGAVARVYIKTQNPMLVLDGDQGIGKSYFARWLVNDLNNFNEGMIQPENKDDQVRLLTTWIWEVKELGATLRKSDTEALKSFLTLESVRVRKPYGHYDIVKPAITSFIGTINNLAGFLVDPTGSRRFNIANILSIDWSYSQTIDRDQVWAEARAAFLDREPWMLTSEEQKQRDEINQEYEIPDPVENALPLYFDINPNETNWFTPTSEIVRILEDQHTGAALHMGSSRMTTMAVAAALLKMGCKSTVKRDKSGKPSRGYLGIKPIRQLP